MPKLKISNATFWVIFKHYDLVAAVLPDRSILTWQKLMENAKIEKLLCDIFGDFWTLYLVAIGDFLKKVIFFWSKIFWQFDQR